MIFSVAAITLSAASAVLAQSSSTGSPAPISTGLAGAPSPADFAGLLAGNGTEMLKSCPKAQEFQTCAEPKSLVVIQTCDLASLEAQLATVTNEATALQALFPKLPCICKESTSLVTDW
jgi:hypothetical protein